MDQADVFGVAEVVVVVVVDVAKVGTRNVNINAFRGRD